MFDLDGTIANTLPLCIQAFRQSIEPLINRTLTDEEIIATFGPSEEGTIKALAPLAYDEGVKSYLHYYEQLHKMCPATFDGIEDLLNHLKEKGIHVSMVTGKGKYSTAISLKHFKLSNFFEIIETGAPSGPRKVDGIKAVLSALPELKPEEVIYVGDAPSDIEASRKVGIPVVAAAWAETAEPEKLIPLKPDEIFYNIEEFKNWLYSNI